MTEFLFCFSCCIGEQPQPQRRRRIDRSMIGEPMNFVHTAHVGSGDANAGFALLYAKKEMRLPVSISLVGRYVQPVSLRAGFRQAIEGGSFQDQMKSKGGYTPGISEVAL